MSNMMVVDGDTGFSELVSKHFMSLNFGVIRASNGREAGTYMKTRSDIDVILLGTNMPDMDGIETLRHILSLDPSAQVIVMTDEVSTDDALDALKMGAFVYCWKPFDINRLAEKVEKAAASKHTM